MVLVCAGLSMRNRLWSCICYIYIYITTLHLNMPAHLLTQEHFSTVSMYFFKAVCYLITMFGLVSRLAAFFTSSSSLKWRPLSVSVL